MKLVSRKCHGGAQGGRIKKIQCKRGIIETFQLELPTMSQIWRGLERPVFPGIIVPGDFYGIMRIGEDLQRRLPRIFEMAQGIVGKNADLSNQARSMAKEAAKEFANLTWHTNKA